MSGDANDVLVTSMTAISLPTRTATLRYATLPSAEVTV